MTRRSLHPRTCAADVRLDGRGATTTHAATPHAATPQTATPQAATPHAAAPRTTTWAAAGLLVLAACAEAQPPGEVLRSGLAYDAAPVVTSAEQQATVDGLTGLTLDLYGELRSEPGNVFFSPYSITTALSMTWAGARGDTESQMAGVLGYTLGQSRQHPALNRLSLDLASRSEGAEGADGEPFRLRIANAVFAEQGYPFLDTYLDTLAVSYDAGVNLMDFAGDPEGARRDINAWVDAYTEGRIDELLAQGTITDLTRLVLTNAIYFNAAWAEKFKEADTADAAFHLLDGTQVQVPTMHRAGGDIRHLAGAGFEAVGLRYDGDELEMVVVVPDAGTLDAFEAGLDPAALGAIFAGLTPAEVSLALPKFEFRYKRLLNEPLTDLGMVDAFTEASDFSGMDGTRDLFISKVIHEAFVKVDESGTEAAAATAVVVELRGSPEGLAVDVDRPFLFFIRDVPTGAILFAGRVVDPR